MQLVLVNPIGEVMEKLERSDETKELARADHGMFLTVGEAVLSLLSTVKNIHSSTYNNNNSNNV